MAVNFLIVPTISFLLIHKMTVLLLLIISRDKFLLNYLNPMLREQTALVSSM